MTGLPHPAIRKAKDTRIRQLEQLVGRLTLENEFLKKANQYARELDSDDCSIMSSPGLSRSRRGAR